MYSIPFALASFLAVVTTTPFRSGLDIEGRRCHTVRIPAVRTAPNGDLIAVFDARWNNIDDAGTGKGEEVETAISRSSDGGKTWSAPKILHDFPWTATEKWAGTDPSLIVDRETKTIFCLYNVLNHAQPGRHYRWVQSSTDNGHTWSAPRDITAELFRPGWTKDRYSFMTSGGGTQLRDGTLLAVINDYSRHEANVFGSDDHGKTWRFFGNPVGVADETKIVELDDGTWMLNARSWAKAGNYRREVYLSKDRGETWTSRPDNGLLDTGANGAIWKTHLPDGRTALLLSNCHSEGRLNLTLKVSFDEGRTWPKTFSLRPGIAAYSDITELDDGRIGILYEAGDKELYERFDFAVLDSTDLTGPVPVENTLREIRARYEVALTSDCAAWWLAFGIDRKDGGYFTCLDRTGKVYDTYKDMSMQENMAWMFQRLYDSRFRDERYLEAARHGWKCLAARGVPERSGDDDPMASETSVPEWCRPYVRAECLMRQYEQTRERKYLDEFLNCDRYIRTELRDPLEHEYFECAPLNGCRASERKGGRTKGFCRIPRYFLTVIEAIDRMLEGERTGSDISLSPAPVEWAFPREGGCHEGLAFSDGVTGVLVWGGGDTIRLTVGRGDLWDHRGGYPWTVEQNYSNIVALVQAGRKDDLLALFKKETPKGEPRNPYMLPLGRVTVKMPGAMLVRGELDPFTGRGRLFLADGRVIALAMAKKERAFSMRFPSGVSRMVSTEPAYESPRVKKELSPLGFASPVVRDTATCGGFDWSLPADPSVALSWKMTDDDLTLATSRGSERPDVSSGYAAVESSSVAEWKSFWGKSARVKVPDPVVQRIFDYGMYRFGAMTDPGGVPAGLQGQWLEDDKLVPWNGDYHFNINVQECYSPAYRGGHFENLMPLFRMVLSWRPLLKDNARKFSGVDGYVLPHSVDDRGICIGGFWTGTIDHGSTAWVADMMFRYVRYSGDVAFLREGAYDFMKGAMTVYRTMMEEKDGRLSIPLGPSPEWCGADVQKAVGRDPSFQLAAAHRLARDLVDAAKLLGEPADPMWLDVERRLPAYVAEGDKGILLFAGQGLSESHRHHSHMAGLYPFNTIDFSDEKTFLDVRFTYQNWISKGCGQWSGWCVPWASVLHTHIGNAEAAVWALQTWDRFFTNPGHGSRHDVFYPGFSVMRRGTNWMAMGVAGDANGEEIMQMDGQCAAVTAIMELMVHEVNGKTEFFRGCPADWKDVSFENIRLSDGTSVSGRRLNGKVEIRK